MWELCTRDQETNRGDACVTSGRLGRQQFIHRWMRNILGESLGRMTSSPKTIGRLISSFVLVGKRSTIRWMKGAVSAAFDSRVWQELVEHNSAAKRTQGVLKLTGLLGHLFKLFILAKWESFLQQSRAELLFHNLLPENTVINPPKSLGWNACSIVSQWY